MKIYFARHGESQANNLHIISNRTMPHGLTMVGREQAVRLADHLQGHSIACIYSSPVLRAVETSTILSEKLDVDVVQVNGLREYDCGIAEGRSDTAAWRLWQEEYDAWTIKRDYNYRIAGGESFDEIRQRFVSFVAGLLASYAHTQSGVVCVSHGGLYSVMLPFVLKNVTADMIVKYGFSYTSCIVAELWNEGLVCIDWNGIPIMVG